MTGSLFVDATKEVVEVLLHCKGEVVDVGWGSFQPEGSTWPSSAMVVVTWTEWERYQPGRPCWRRTRGA